MMHTAKSYLNNLRIAAIEVERCCFKLFISSDVIRDHNRPAVQLNLNMESVFVCSEALPKSAKTSYDLLSEYF